jgi:hypothetical protein
MLTITHHPRIVTSPLLKSRLLASLRPRTPIEEDIRLAERILDNPSEPPYTLKFMLEYAHENEYRAAAILHLIDLLRLRRQNVLKGAYANFLALKFLLIDLLRLRWKNVLKGAHMNPFSNIFQGIRFFIFALRLQKEMGEIFVELYRYSGDEDVFKEIHRARSVNYRLIEKMIRARYEYRESNPSQEDTIQETK